MYKEFKEFKEFKFLKNLRFCVFLARIYYSPPFSDGDCCVMDKIDTPGTKKGMELRAMGVN